MLAAMETVMHPTSRGAIVGARVAGGVRRFAGIRYATADRFCPPVALDGWADGFAATSFGDTCVQMPVFSPLVPGGSLGAEESEDCLSLNVWMPQTEGASPLPVLVWIHGGSFLTGSSAQATYDGAALSALGAIVVSINYRVGPLGFCDLRSVRGAGADWVPNAGLRDVVCALGWVRRHIDSFGGDPANVTVMGESAGGGTILHLLGMPHRAELFDRAIVQSGSAGQTFMPDVGRMIGKRYAAAAGAGDDAARLKALGPRDLIAAIGTTMSDPEVWSTAGMMPFHPMIDDEIVLTAPLDALRSGAAAGCDLIIAANRDEMNLFVEAGSMEPEKLAKRVARYIDRDVHAAQQLVVAYTETLRKSRLPHEAIDVWGAIFSDREMTLPIRELLTAAAAHHSATFGYLFTWSAPPRSDGRPLGAAHAIDLPFTFGTFGVDNWREFVGASGNRAGTGQAVSDALQIAIVEFCTRGNPGWRSWNADRTVYEFGATCGEQRDPLAARAALWENV